MGFFFSTSLYQANQIKEVIILLKKTTNFNV